MMAIVVHAEDIVVEPKPVLPLVARHANWIFSGAVSNESGETYEYFFQAKRNEDKVHAVVSLIDAQSKAVIFMQNSDAQLAGPETDNWVIGDVFLRYNTINSSWVFGLKKENQIGFNFKVDMLQQSDKDPRSQNLQRGVKMMITQTGQVNGHVQLKGHEAAQFVSGNHAWFRQIMLNKVPSQSSDQLHGLFCHFDDGGGLYSLKIVGKDTTRETFSGLYNAKGASTAISQFIYVDHLGSGPWRVRVPYPKLQFEFSNLLEDEAVVLGFINQKETPGFCVINKESLI